MKTELRIKFFKIHRCGYYRQHSSNPSYGDKSSLLRDLFNWINDKSISETSTYEPADEQDSNILHTYCYALNHNPAGDYLLTTWNETATTDGAIASVRLDGRVGEAVVTSAEVEDGFQPGYPAYFWFPSGLDVYATIQIRNRLNGRHNLEEFVKGFLAKFSKFVVLGECSDSTDQIIGYSESGRADDIDRSRPSFKSSEYRTEQNADFISENRDRIRKLVRRDVMTFSYAETASLWQVMWRNVTGQKTAPQLTGEHNLHFEVDFTPNPDELTKIIRHWESERTVKGVSDRFQDVGFRLMGEQKVHWLSKAIASDLYELDLTFTRPPLADGAALLSQLRRRRRHILALLREGGVAEGVEEHA